MAGLEIATYRPQPEEPPLAKPPARTKPGHANHLELVGPFRAGGAPVRAGRRGVRGGGPEEPVAIGDSYQEEAGGAASGCARNVRECDFEIRKMPLTS
jgi:hypothetical protein